MGVTAKKKRSFGQFLLNLAIYGKTVCEHLWILSEILIFLTPVKIHIPDYWVLLIQNMVAKTQKYGVSANFCHKLGNFGKTIG
jgi:hypothetical protein